MPERPYDLILYGASGFTGKQTVEYCRRFAPAGLRWAIAGRNPGKLDAANCAGVNVLIAAANDAAALDHLASQTRVVATTAGPFSLYGSALVEACVRNRTHYCDITGETPWARGLIDRHHEQAKADGTRIIPFCGFDSIPSDYGAWMLAQALPDVERISAYFKLGGGVNGGTMATGLHAAETGDLHAIADPFLLDPDPRGHSAEERARNGDPASSAHFDADIGAWVTSFFMGPINTRVVRRTMALLGGPQFAYQEYMRFDDAFTARLAAAGGWCLDRALRTAGGRGLIRLLAPKPGEGPSVKTMDTGFFECEFVAHGRGGKRLSFIVKSYGDPGNRITVKCLCEAAFVLAALGQPAPGSGGVLTPVSGLGEPLVARLRQAGMVFERPR